ncbi:MAG: nuclear transport factor 2 family protein [Pseudomonadota bacterium]
MKPHLPLLAGALLAFGTTHAMAESDLEARITALEDTAAIEALVHCYSASNDIIFVNRHRVSNEVAVALGVERLQDCFTPDAEFTVTFFANSDEPWAVVSGLEEWANVVVAFGEQNNITSTRHASGGIEVDIKGDTATVRAQSVTPHFQATGGENAAPSNLLLIGDYVGTAVRSDGGWVMTDWLIDVVENQQVSGIYPFGFHPGTN